MSFKKIILGTTFLAVFSILFLTTAPVVKAVCDPNTSLVCKRSLIDAITKQIAILQAQLPVQGGQDTGNLKSNFLKSDKTAQSIALDQVAQYDIRNLSFYSPFDTTIFGYRFISTLRMLGYTASFMPGNQAEAFLNNFEQTNGYAKSPFITKEILIAADSQLAQAEIRDSALANNFPIYKYYIDAPNNEPPKEHATALFSNAFKNLPSSLVTWSEQGFSDYLGFQQPARIRSEIMSDNYTICDPTMYQETRDTCRLTGITQVYSYSNDFDDAVLLLHEYGHYLDGNIFEKATGVSRGIIDTTGFYNISYNVADIKVASNGWKFYTYRNPTNIKNEFVSAYAQGWGYSENSTYYTAYEDFAESFAMYVTQGKVFRALAATNSAIKQKYDWLKQNVFNGTEYSSGVDNALSIIKNNPNKSQQLQVATGVFNVEEFSLAVPGFVWDENPFPIVAPTTTQLPIKILSPNGGESFTAGQNMGVSWQNPVSLSSSSDIIKLNLLDYNGGSPAHSYNLVTTLSGTLPGNTLRYTYVIPSNMIPSSKLKVEVQLWRNGAMMAKDDSDNYFSITGPLSAQPTITVTPLLAGITITNGSGVHVMWKTQGNIGKIGIGFCPEGQSVGSGSCTPDVNYDNTGDTTVGLFGQLSLNPGRWVLHVIDTTNRSVYGVDNGYFTIEGSVVNPPLSANCKVKTYQDKFYSGVGEHCLDNIKIVPVYFLGKDQIAELIPSWSENMRDIFAKVEPFYESQFSNKIQITTEQPQIIYGDKNIGEYASTIDSSLEIINKLNLKLSPDYFTNLAIFYHSPIGSYTGLMAWQPIDGNGSMTLNPWFWLEKDGMCTVTTSAGTSCQSYEGVAHEFGHALGMMHPWDMDINKDNSGNIIENNFKNVQGSVMGYYGSNLLSGNVNNPLGGYFLMDEAKQRMIIQTVTPPTPPTPVSPFITVTSPNAGDMWYVGETKTVTYSTNVANGIVYVYLKRYDGNGTETGSYLIKKTTSNETQIPFTVTQEIVNALGGTTNTFKIRIFSVSTGSPQDYSEYFSIAGPMGMAPGNNALRASLMDAIIQLLQQLKTTKN